MVPLLGEAIAQRIEQHKGDGASPRTCLDVGCGEQPMRALVVQSGFEYSGFDVQQNAAGTVDHLGAIDAALPESLQSRRFDLILCTEVLEHVADWPHAFANLASLLNTGGRLLITCPHIWVPHEEPYDFFRPTSWGVAHHAQRAGLTALEVTRLGDGYDVLGTVLAAVRLRAPRGRPWMWLVAGPAALLRKLALTMLNQRWMKAFIELRTGLYLNTIAVFERR
jgi:SAM-dependent methyltransferase